ncbi:MAG: hypothetical protein SLRJCFUN_002280 [Candidatus Fervidibacter sp.]
MRQHIHAMRGFQQVNQSAAVIYPNHLPMAVKDDTGQIPPIDDKKVVPLQLPCRLLGEVFERCLPICSDCWDKGRKSDGVPKAEEGAHGEGEGHTGEGTRDKGQKCQHRHRSDAPTQLDRFVACQPHSPVSDGVEQERRERQGEGEQCHRDCKEPFAAAFLRRRGGCDPLHRQSGDGRR